jgi:hypothetical protein
MNHKLCTLITVTASLFLGSVAVSAQAQKPAPAAKTSTWAVGHTPDGQPDMQGTWTNASNVPLVRPKELGAKEFFTGQEQADYLKRAKNGYVGDTATPIQAHYDRSQFGLDRSQGKFAPNLRTSLIVGPEGRIPPYTAEARKRLAEKAAKAKGHEFDGPENRNPGERCIVNNAGPPMLPTGYNNDLEIVQGPGYVAIMQEMIHDTRIIPLDGRPHTSSDIRQWRGDSRGHWEGNTLVVDTINFTDKTAFRGSTRNLHVVERFTRTGPETINYQFTVDDPSTWEKSWTVEIVMGPAPGQIYEYACHEANQSMTNLLSSARNLEKEAAEAKK